MSKQVDNLGDNKAQIDQKSKKETDKTENKDEVSEKLHLEEVSDASQTLIIGKPVVPSLCINDKSIQSCSSTGLIIIIFLILCKYTLDIRLLIDFRS